MDDFVIHDCCWLIMVAVLDMVGLPLPQGSHVTDFYIDSSEIVSG